MGVGGTIRLDFEGDAVRSAVEDEVGFPSGGGSPKGELSEGMGETFATDDVLNDKTLPARSTDRVVLCKLERRKLICNDGFPMYQSPWKERRNGSHR
jgi:hypothetical protein